MKRRRRKQKHEKRIIKGKVSRTNVQKKKNSFKRRRSEKIGDTRIEYKRDVKHKNISKTFSKIKSFLVRRFKMKVFFEFKKLKKQKNWRCKKRPKTFKKKRRSIKNTCTQEEGKMEQEMICVQKRKSEENKLEKREKKKGDEKPKLKKSKAKTNQRRETRREKGKEEKRLCKREKEGGSSKMKPKNILFLKKIIAKRKNENIICAKREDTFFQRKGFFRSR